MVSIKNKSFSVTAEVDVPDGGAEGVIIAQGGRFGGWAVYAKDGKAKFVYNVLGIQEFATEADAPIPAGTHQVRMEFAYDGGGLAKGGDVTLYYDGTAGRHRPGRGHPADGLLRRRDDRHRLRVRHHRHPRLHRPRAAGSPARSTGCRSTSATTTTTTSSTPRNASGSPWRGSSGICGGAIQHSQAGRQPHPVGFDRAAWRSLQNGLAAVLPLPVCRLPECHMSVARGSRCAAQVVRAETVALKGPMLPEVSTARTRK